MFNWSQLKLSIAHWPFPLLTSTMCIGTEVIMWIQHYLENRSQFVQIGNGKSKITPMKSGVPQGSMIGPLLYAIFTNKASEVVKNQDCQNTVHLDRSKLFGVQCTDCGVLTSYADDTTYVVNSKHRWQNQDTISRTLDRMSEFLNENKLAINLPNTDIT